jgi:hypothetical protein
MSREIVFEADLCNCDHAPSAHDDGFGCTEPDCQAEGCICPCLAGWAWEDVILAEDLPW